MSEKICVVGVDKAGWSIAQVFASARFEVTLCDQSLEYAQAGKQALEQAVLRSVRKGALRPGEADETLARITPREIESASECGFVLESVIENMQVKRDLFLRLEEITGSETVLATNTSWLSITELASALQHPERVVGMHFFKPATVMELVEVVRCAQTNDRTREAVMKLAQAVGKTPIEVEEAPGFVVNRILVPMVNEAVGVLAEGVAGAEEIDTAMKLGANHPMGPLALGDLIGLDVCLAIMEVMQVETGDSKYRPHPLLRKMVRARRLGRKTGRGFFDYE